MAGFALGSVLFIDRMGRNVAVSPYSDYNAHPEDPIANTDPDTVVYRISGAFFFGAARDRRLSPRPGRRWRAQFRA